MRSRPRPPRVHLELETLESRLVPSYVLSGDAWPSPQLVTISFVPDGTIIGSNSSGPIYSNLFATMDKRFGSPSVWEGVILKAAQTWEEETNINFSVVSDNGTPIGQGLYQQGDPGMGDIRIGGYALSNGWLGNTFMPPPGNNYSIAGDIQLNTGVSWSIPGTHTSGYDLQTVALHEFGHALGLYNTTSPSQDVMYSSYTGVKTSLATDDINGIQAIYSSGNPRSQDVYNSGGASNGTLATAANISSLIDPILLTALVPNLEIDSPTQAEYFTFTAPTLTSGNLTVNVQSSGLSLLTPSLTVYASNGTTVLGSATAAGDQDGATLTVNVSGVTAGTQYYVMVTGADSTVMSTGTYAMTLNFGTGPSPTVPLPVTTLLDGIPIQGGAGQPELPPQGELPPAGDSGGLPVGGASLTAPLPGPLPLDQGGSVIISSAGSAASLLGQLSTLVAPPPGVGASVLVGPAANAAANVGLPQSLNLGPSSQEDTDSMQGFLAPTNSASSGSGAPSSLSPELAAAYFATAAGNPLGF